MWERIVLQVQQRFKTNTNGDLEQGFQKKSEEDKILIEKVKKTSQTTGENISGLVDSKSGLNSMKPFQKAG